MMSAPKYILRSLGIGPMRLLCTPGFLLIWAASLLLMTSPAKDLRVHAVDQETREPIDRVRVELVEFPSTVARMGYTDGTGWVEFLDLNVERCILRATKDQYQPYQETLDLDPVTPSIRVDVQLRRLDAKPEQPSGIVSARAISIPEKARKEFQKGMVLLGEKNDPKASLSHFRKAIEAFPAYYEAYYLLGMAQLKTGDEAGGESSLRKSIQLNPKFLDPYYPLAELLIRRTQYNEAEALLQTPYQEDPQDWKWPYELAMCYNKLGQLGKGIAMGRAALERKDAPSKVRLLLANLYENNGEPAKAIAELEEFKKQDPENPMTPKVDLVLEQLRAKIRSSGE